jgi:hypothetical protein
MNFIDEERALKQCCQETIVALATPPGCGGMGVVRVSGPLVPEIAEKILEKTPEPVEHISVFLKMHWARRSIRGFCYILRRHILLREKRF